MQFLDDACSEYAKIKAVVGVVCALIVGILGIIFGLHMGASAEKYTQHVTATVTNKTPCTTSMCHEDHGSRECYDCDFDLTYEKNGKTIVPKKLPASQQTTHLEQGSHVDVLCNKNDPTDCTMKMPYTTLKYAAIFGGVACVIVAIVCAVLTFHFKWFRRFTCVSDAAQMISNI